MSWCHSYCAQYCHESDCCIDSCQENCRDQAEETGKSVAGRNPASIHAYGMNLAGPAKLVPASNGRSGVMTRYYYEAHQGDGTLDAESDAAALAKLKEKFGESLIGLMSVSVEESEYHSRVIWME